MIFTAFVILATFLLSLVTAALPTSTGFPPEVTAAFSTFAGYVAMMDTLLPVSTLAAVLLILISVDVSIFTFKTLKWLVSYIPVIGGRG